jgi:hypothetical protein
MNALDVLKSMAAFNMTAADEGEVSIMLAAWQLA